MKKSVIGILICAVLISAVLGIIWMQGQGAKENPMDVEPLETDKLEGKLIEENPIQVEPVSPLTKTTSGIGRSPDNPVPLGTPVKIPHIKTKYDVEFTITAIEEKELQLYYPKIKAVSIILEFKVFGEAEDPKQSVMCGAYDFRLLCTNGNFHNNAFTFKQSHDWLDMRPGHGGNMFLYYEIPDNETPYCLIHEEPCWSYEEPYNLLYYFALK